MQVGPVSTARLWTPRTFDDSRSELAPRQSGARSYKPDPANGIGQARMKHVCVRLRLHKNVLGIPQGIKAALSGLVDVPEQAVLPQDGGEVRCLFEVQIRHFLQSHKVFPRKLV